MKSDGKIVYKTVSLGPRSDCCTFYLRIYAKLCGRLANVLSLINYAQSTNVSRSPAQLCINSQVKSAAIRSRAESFVGYVMIRLNYYYKWCL